MTCPWDHELVNVCWPSRSRWRSNWNLLTVACNCSFLVVLCNCNLYVILHMFADSSNAADDLFNSVRVLCYIPCSEESLRNSAKAVLRTWGRRCNKIILFTKKKHKNLPTVAVKIPDNGKGHLEQEPFGLWAIWDRNHLDYGPIGTEPFGLWVIWDWSYLDYVPFGMLFKAGLFGFWAVWDWGSGLFQLGCDQNLSRLGYFGLGLLGRVFLKGMGCFSWEHLGPAWDAFHWAV